jgi:hypothetical protein
MIPALGRLRHDNHLTDEFEANLGNRVRSCLRIKIKLHTLTQEVLEGTLLAQAPLNNISHPPSTPPAL